MKCTLSSYLEHISQAVGHRSRMSILAALMGGKALPAGELAFRAKVTFQTASSHLRILERHGFIRAKKCGRHRYYELASPESAGGLEHLSASLRDAPCRVPDHLRCARFCYDHLAGELSILITQSLIQHGALCVEENGFGIREGHNLWSRFEVSIAAVRKSRRKLAPECIDWSERQPHIAGALGAAIATSLERKGCIERSVDDRSVVVTEIGHRFLCDVLQRRVLCTT